MPEKTELTCPECKTSKLLMFRVINGRQLQCWCGFVSVIYPSVKGVKKKHAGKESIMVKCPFCNKKHYHSPNPIPGLRRSHCGYDGKTGAQMVKYIRQYPNAYTGGTYYIEEIEE